MTWYVYILLCDQKTFYVGMSSDLEKRLNQHRRKESFYTKKFSDFQLVYTERYSRRGRAEKREQQIKKWSATKKRALVSGDKDLLSQLSKSPGFVGVSSAL